MTAISKRVRGALIGFSSTFTDEDGVAYTPTTATIRLVYYVSGVATTSSYSMTIASATATYAWDSSVADANYVHWFITAGATSQPADQGSFLLTANAANPAP
jgi:hypothetical protein